MANKIKSNLTPYKERVWNGLNPAKFPRILEVCKAQGFEGEATENDHQNLNVWLTSKHRVVCPSPVTKITFFNIASTAV